MIQSVIFPKSKFSVLEAVKWIEEHKYLHTKVDETENFYRFRQHDPIPGVRYYTKTLPNGVELIIATK
jgi:hypothetical protein